MISNSRSIICIFVQNIKDEVNKNIVRMKRTKLAELIAWKNSPSRKPLIIRGARQVGKTWLMKEFGNTQYAQTVYVNFEKNKRLKALFEDDFDIKKGNSGLTGRIRFNHTR